MTKKLLSDFNQYYNEISKAIICKKSTKKAFLADLKKNVTAFIEDNQITSLDRVIAHFGQTEDIVNSFTETMDPLYLKKAVSWKKIVLIGIVISALMLALFWSVAALDSYFHETDRVILTLLKAS